MAKFTNQQKFEEARREIGLRRYVYQNRIAQGRMKQEAADEYIALMQEIADDYFELAAKDKAASSLFANQK